MMPVSDAASTYQFPPGPDGDPTADILPAFLRDPLRAQHEWWESFGDIWSVPLPTERIVFVAHPDLAEYVLTNHLDHGRFARNTAPAQGATGITSLVGAPWRRARLLAQPMFSRKHLRELAPLMVEAIDRHLKQLEPRARSGEPFDMARFLGEVTIRVLFHAMFSDEFSDDEINFAVSHLPAIGTYKAELVLRDWLPPGTPIAHEREGKAAVAELDKLLYRAIRRRRTERRDDIDLLGRLLAARDEDGLGFSDSEIRDHLTVLIFAGYDTTQWATAWALGLLAMNAQPMSMLRQEVDALGDRTPTADDLPNLEYTRAVVQEALRHQGILLLPRELEFDDTIGGFRLPAGTLVCASPSVIHQRKDLWGDPECFRPDRFLELSGEQHHKYQMLAFGGGPRLCLGVNMAFFEAQFLLAMLLRRYDYRVRDGWTPKHKYQYIVGLEGGLPVTIARRQKTPRP